MWLAASPRRQVLRRVRHADRRRRSRRHFGRLHRRSRRPEHPDRGTSPCLDPVHRPGGLHIAGGGPGRGGDPRAPVALLRSCQRGDRSLRRHDREVHRRRGHGRMGRPDRPGERRRTGSPRGPRRRRRSQDARPRHQRPRRGPDRRSGSYDRGDEPGHGRGRPGQHRLEAAIGRAARNRPGRRVHRTCRQPGDRIRTGRGPGPQGQASAGSGIPRDPRRCRTGRPRTGRPARGAVPRP